MTPLGALRSLLEGRRVVALTGAGCSTDSGIPDYRGPDGLQRARVPIRYGEFVASEPHRQRYWARSVAGWPRFSAAVPNRAHWALAQMEAQGSLVGVITQNVDRLHHAAGSRRVVELHGALARVRCLQCGAYEDRAVLQERLLALNPWMRETDARMAPDGDAELDREAEARFRVAACHACGGVLKPDVVFFGENVPRHIVDAAWGMLDEADALLVLGSSLTVFSGYRFVLGARERRLPVAIVNRGITRGDPFATLKLDMNVAEALAG